MAIIEASFFRDANSVPITTAGLIISKSIVYDGTAGLGNASETITLFTVTGDVIVHVFGVCSESLVGATTLEIGVASATAGLVAQTTATDIDANMVWIDASPDETQALPGAFILTGGADIIETIGVADVTDGTINHYCLWRPLSSNANIVAA